MHAEMKIVYYTSGTTGSGRIVTGIAIGNALKRADFECEYTIIHSSPFGWLIEESGFKDILIPVEHEKYLTEKNYEHSILYRTLTCPEPDILLVDMLWFSISSFIQNLKCRKIFLCLNPHQNFFSIDLGRKKLQFKPENYDLLLKTEPFDSPYHMDEINPVVMLNRNEILSREDAISRLGLDSNTKNVLVAVNGKPGEFEEVNETCSSLKKQGYIITASSNYYGGLFPAVAYYNAFDLIVTGGGYNSFWETRFFNKEAIHIPPKRRFENIRDRLNRCKGYEFTQNGADQLVEIIKGI